MARPVIVHSLAQALAAAEAAESLGKPIRILSAAAAAGYAGPAWFAEMIAATRRAHPKVAIEAVLDCGVSPGDVLAALRRRIEVVSFDGPPALRRKLAAIAHASGARVEMPCADALDLDASADPYAAVVAWLSGRIGV